MAITAAERKKVPKEDWGDWRGSPETSAFPIRNQEDLDSAAHLIGKAGPGVKAKIIAIAKRKGLTLPAAWTTDAGMSSDVVHRTGLIFKAGSYPAQQMEVSAEDLQAAVSAFTAPVDAELEHINTQGERTFLDGKLGQLVEVWAEGDSLYGKLAVPTWLDPLWAEFGRKVSIVLSRAKKHITRIGLVLNPQVEEAAVMSAYAAFSTRHDTPHGQNTMQRIHDMAAQSGAICTQSREAGYVSQHESTGLQAVHDMAAQHGATCPGSAGYVGYATTPSAPTFAGSRHSRNDAADIQQIHALAVQQGAECGPVAASMSKPASPGRRFDMQLDSIKFWKGLGRRARDEARQEGISTVPDEEVFTVLADTERAELERIRAEQESAFATRLAEADAKVQQANAAVFAATAQRLQGEAAAFADSLILASKLMPAEREGLIAALTTAGMDDAAHGQVTFANGAQGSRVEQLKNAYSARPAHGLTREQLGGHAPFTVVAGGTQQATGPDAYDDATLLNMTATGRLAASRKKA